MRCAGPSRGSPLPDLEPPRLAVHPPHLRPGVAPEAESPPVVRFLQHPPGEGIRIGVGPVLGPQACGTRRLASASYAHGGGSFPSISERIADSTLGQMAARGLAISKCPAPGIRIIRTRSPARSAACT